MNNIQLHSEYELLISEENSLLHKLSTCESLMSIIFAYLLEKGYALHVMAVEDVLNAIHD